MDAERTIRSSEWREKGKNVFWVTRKYLYPEYHRANIYTLSDTLFWCLFKWTQGNCPILKCPFKRKMLSRLGSRGVGRRMPPGDEQPERATPGRGVVGVRVRRKRGGAITPREPGAGSRGPSLSATATRGTGRALLLSCQWGCVVVVRWWGGGGGTQLEWTSGREREGP